MFKRKSMFLRFLATLLITFHICFDLIPVIWIFVSSFKTNFEFIKSPIKFPSKLSLENYISVLTYGGSSAEEPLWKFLLNSFIVSFVATLIVLSVTALASYALLYSFPLKRLCHFLLSFGLFLPTSAFMIPYFIIISKLGLYDTRLGISLVYSGMTIPLGFLIIHTYMRDSIDSELIEAAFIDGASFHRIFKDIVIPLSRGGILTASIFLWINSWNELLYALLLSQSEKSRTIQVAISSMIATYTANYPQAFAAVLLSILPVVIIYILLNKYILTGLSFYVKK